MQEYDHKAKIKYDNDPGPVIFNWHWPRGTFDERMSALELAAFVMPHMPSVLPMLAGDPKIQAEFLILLMKLATTPANVLDEVVPWIKSVVRTSDNDTIQMDLRAKPAKNRRPLHFIVST